jgi:hypothetical protein
MKDTLKLIDSVGTPNDYIKQIPAQPKTKKLKLPIKISLVDAFMYPVAIGIAISLGFLIYQLSQLAGITSQLAGVIGMTII